MPTYEYECTKCEYIFEKFHSMSQSPSLRCPKCRYKARKLVGAGAGIIFKGSGFYETDYKRAGSKPPPESSSSTESASKSSTKSDSKSSTESGSKSKSSD